MRTATTLLVVALAMACGDDDGDTDTGANDDTSASGSATMSSSESEGSGSGSGTMSGSASASVGESSSAGDSSTGSATDGTTDGSATQPTTDDGSSGPGDSSESGSESGGICSGMQDSCANGELCCEGLVCCEGVPVPVGQEYCDLGCPDSDRNIKENFAAVDSAAMLAEISALPITSWNYTFEDPRVRHIGPMAQDFSAAFAVGATDKAIAKIDADGVALAAIQALHRRAGELREENDELRERLAKLERSIESR